MSDGISATKCTIKERYDGTALRTTTIVRVQRLSAWIDWLGMGGCPIERASGYIVRYRNGKEQELIGRRDDAFWCHRWGDYDIVAYRLIRPDDQT